MTWWAPLDVLGYARGAGWVDADAKVATALALMASGGADHYDGQAIDPGNHDRGLWTLSTARVAPDQAPNLYDPTFNAATAALLWARYGHTWAWHGAWSSDGGAGVRRLLGQLDSAKLWVAPRRKVYDAVLATRAIFAGHPGAGT